MPNDTTITTRKPVDIDQDLFFECSQNTGFSQLSTRDSHDPSRSLSRDSHDPSKNFSRDSKETPMSKIAFGNESRVFDTFLDNATDIRGKERLSLSVVIYNDLMPALIRKLKGMGYEASQVDSDYVMEIFDDWYNMLYEKAVVAGMNTKEELPYQEEIFRRFAEMFESTLYRERDWVYMTRLLIESRQGYTSRSEGFYYPEELQTLEISLVQQNVRLNSTEAAAVLLVWEMADHNTGSIFFISQRNMGAWAAQLVGLELRNDDHAKVLGRAVLAKLQRLGIIFEHERGKSYSKIGRKDGKATSFKWVWGQPIDHVER